MIALEIREEVRRRAAAADSEKEIGNIVMNAVLSNDVDVQNANRDGVKQLIVDGVIAYRQSHNTVADFGGGQPGTAQLDFCQFACS